MKRSTLISFTAVVSLAACHDATAPDAPSPTPLRDASVSMAGADSGSAWATVALEDAATRLLATLQDSPERRRLKRALSRLAILVARGERWAAVHASSAEAHDALERLRSQSDPASVPDLDAIALAIDGVVSQLDRHEHK